VIRWPHWLATARASGGTAGADPAAVHRESARLVAFSDAVFAITITLLVLEIKPPSDYGNLLHGLGTLWPSYLAYAVTFLFIGQVWANHHVMFDHIRAGRPSRPAPEHPAVDGRGVPPIRHLRPRGRTPKRRRRADRRRLLRHRLRRNSADLQRRLAIRPAPPPGQRNPRPGRRDGDQQPGSSSRSPGSRSVPSSASRFRSSA
jgi:hypothetical protein